MRTVFSGGLDYFYVYQMGFMNQNGARNDLGENKLSPKEKSGTMDFSKLLDHEIEQFVSHK